MFDAALLIEYQSFISFIYSTILMVDIVYLRYRKPDLKRPYKVELSDFKYIHMHIYSAHVYTVCTTHVNARTHTQMRAYADARTYAILTGK